MDKIIFANGTEFEIKEGASLDRITVSATSLEELEPLKEALTAKGNLDIVKFTVNGEVSGEYEDMILVLPVFQSVDILNNSTLEAVFAIREKTDVEKRLDDLEAGQEVQDGAIVELAEIVGGE